MLLRRTHCQRSGVRFNKGTENTPSSLRSCLEDDILCFEVSDVEVPLGMEQKIPNIMDGDAAKVRRTAVQSIGVCLSAASHICKR